MLVMAGYHCQARRQWRLLPEHWLLDEAGKNPQSGIGTPPIAAALRTGNT